MSGEILHKNLAAGRWHKLTFAEQMANIGSEVGRACRSQNRDEVRFWAAVIRAMELFNLTFSDKRWGNRLKELSRVYEVFCDAVLGGKMYGSALKDLDRYFNYFGILAARERYG